MANEVRIPSVLKDKVIKRYSPATIFYGFLMLLFALIPVVSLFFPSIGYIDSTSGEVITATNLELLKGVALQSNILSDFLDANSSSFGAYSSFIWIAIFALGLLMCWPLSVALIQFFKGFKLILVGQSRHMARPICTAVFAFISLLVFNAGVIAAMYVLTYFCTSASLSVEFTYNLIQLVFLGIELLFLIIMIIIHSLNFSHKAYPYEIDFDAYETDLILEDLKPLEAKGIEVKRNKILNHEFSKSDIMYAAIPSGVKTIGDGAFSNCVHLVEVYLPRSIKKIGANAFFNCVSINKIVYNGYIRDWGNIVRGSNWLLKAGTNIVICKDGAISVNK